MKILFLILTLTVAGIFLGACQTAEKPNAVANSKSLSETPPTANTRASETFNSDANLNRMQNGGAMRDDRGDASRSGDETGERENRGESKGYDERNRTEGDDRNNRSEGDDRRNRNDNRSINSNTRRRGDEGERHDRRNNDDRRDNENESDGDGE